MRGNKSQSPFENSVRRGCKRRLTVFQIAPCLLDDVQPFAVAALALVVGTRRLVGALHHVGAGRRGGNQPGLGAGVLQAFFAPLQGAGDAVVVEFGEKCSQRILGVEAPGESLGVLLRGGGVGQEAGTARLMQRLQLLLHLDQFLQPVPARRHGYLDSAMSMKPSANNDSMVPTAK